MTTDYIPQSSLLRDSLNIWCGTRFTELTWTICGNDKLGILPPTESDNPWKGTVPVTPIMDTQLDEIAINSFTKPYSAHLLQELHHKMTNQDTTDWYEVLLSLIIILHNFQWMSKDIKEYTVRHGMEVSPQDACQFMANSYKPTENKLSWSPFVITSQYIRMQILTRIFSLCLPRLEKAVFIYEKWRRDGINS